MQKHFKITGLAVCLALCLSILGSLWFFFYDQNYLPFDSKKWKEASRDEWKPPTTRQKMVEDLMAKHKLVGMKRKEIENLLGNPSEPGETEYYYFLGQDRGLMPIDNEYLLIKFNNDVVEEARIIVS